MSGIVHSTPYSAMALRSQVNGRSWEMEGSISGLWALIGALDYYGMGMRIGSPNIATGSWIKVPTIGGLRMV
jgi:hypothetical protein